MFADSVAEGAVVCSNMSKAATITYPGTYPGTYPAFTSTIKCVDNSCSPATARLIGGRTVFIANGQGDNAGSRPVVILLHGTNIASWTAFCANNFNFGLEYKAKMVKNLVNAGYTVVAPQTAWGDRVQHPRFYRSRLY